MNIRAIILAVCVSFAFLSLNSLATSQNIPAVATKPFDTKPGITNTDSHQGEEKGGVNDEDINRFTNTIVLIKDFYVQKVGDKSLLDDAIRVMVSGLDPPSEYLWTM